MRTVSIPGGSGRAAAPKRLLALARDERLVEQIRRGDELAFEVAYERHAPAILSFCRHMLGSREEAEDAVQQAFASAFRDLGRDDREINLKPWLFAIARNRCLSMLRARREHASRRASRSRPRGLRSRSSSEGSCATCCTTSTTCPSSSARRCSCRRSRALARGDRRRARLQGAQGEGARLQGAVGADRAARRARRRHAWRYVSSLRTCAAARCDAAAAPSPARLRGLPRVPGAGQAPAADAGGGAPGGPVARAKGERAGRDRARRRLGRRRSPAGRGGGLDCVAKLAMVGVLAAGGRSRATRLSSVRPDPSARGPSSGAWRGRRSASAGRPRLSSASRPRACRRVRRQARDDTAKRAARPAAPGGGESARRERAPARPRTG